MPGPFSNPIVGGVGTLVRSFIQSVNYVASVSGWRINRDGSAEFNIGTFRGKIINGGMFIYSGVPAAGNLIFAVSPTAGNDGLGNTFLAGTNFRATASNAQPGGASFGIGDNTAGYLSYVAPSPGMNGQLILSGRGQFQAFILDDSALQGFLETGSFQWIPTTPGSGGFQVSQGFSGLYYYERWSVGATTVSGLTQITSFTLQKSANDYPSEMSSGVWTCPITGRYSISLSCAHSAVLTAASEIRGYINGTAAANLFLTDGAASGAAVSRFREEYDFVTGDTLRFFITATANIIADNRSHLTIGRHI